MKSLRAQLYLLWVLLAASAAGTGFLLWAFYSQSAAVQIAGAEVEVSRGCRAVADQYAFFTAGWSGPTRDTVDSTLAGELGGVTTAALRTQPGLEGGFWADGSGPVGYAFPTWDGSGSRPSGPARAVASALGDTAPDVLRGDRTRVVTLSGTAQSTVLGLCRVDGPIGGLVAWTAADVFTGRGSAYSQLLIGLAILAATVLGAALLLGRTALGYAGRLGRLERALTEAGEGDERLPALRPTGERELDRLVEALNRAGLRLADARLRLAAAERLATVGSLAAGIAHEIRNPLAAMRIKAENALAAEDSGRARAALDVVLHQVARLDRLLEDLLGLAKPRSAHLTPADPDRIVAGAIELHAEEAARAGAVLTSVSHLSGDDRPDIDPEELAQALSNLILNAIQAVAQAGRGGTVTVTTERVHADAADRLRIGVADTGPGVPDSVRERAFEPFETSRAGGHGLGLAIVREIARAHRGEVSLADPAPDGVGASFVLEVPWRAS